MNIIEAIRARHSVRSFDGQGLSDEQLQTLHQAVSRAESPFGGNVTIRLSRYSLKRGYRPSTYGMIRGAEYFFLISMADDRQSALSAGFRFEQVVLAATSHGLGCCWIAATFKDSDFKNDEPWPEGETLKVVCPVGLATRPALMERLTRTALGSKSRKPFPELFFLNDFITPLPADNRFAEALEMMRLAPSSANSQPWRAVVTDAAVHFYCKAKNDSLLPFIDCGIGLCHFHETERFNGHTGTFFTYPAVPTPPSGLHYLISYRIPE